MCSCRPLILRIFSRVLPVFRECSRIAGGTLVRGRTSCTARHLGDAVTAQISVILQVPRVHVMTAASVASGTAGGRVSGVDRTPIDRGFRRHSLFLSLSPSTSRTRWSFLGERKMLLKSFRGWKLFYRSSYAIYLVYIY